MRRRHLLCSSLAVLPWPLLASSWPERPIRVIVPGSPGAPSDVAMRALQDALSRRLGQPIVIENKAGGQGLIGVDAVAKSAPDGYTLGIINLQTSAAPAMRTNSPFDLLRDLTPIAQLTTETPLLLVRTSLGIASVKELVARAGATPGTLTYGSAGAGSPSHLGMELLQRDARIRLLHIPYRSIAQVVTDLGGGQVDFALAGSAAASQGLAGGKVRALAISSPRRHPAFPEVPTLAEAGFAGIDLRGWTGVVAPAGTPAPVVARLNRDITAALAEPAVQKRLETAGAQPAAGTREAFATFVRSEVARWKSVVVDARITAD